MTTIAYKNGIVAYDSRTTRNNIIISDQHEKCHRLDHDTFMIYTGATADGQRIMDNFTGVLEPMLIEDEYDPISGVLICDKVVFNIENDGKYLYFTPIVYCESQDEIENNGNHYAWGSGEFFATSAMDFGETAKKAVEYAMTRDSCTGGEVKTFNVLEMKVVN